MICEEARSLIKRFEGFRALAYKCPSDVWTIGYGHTKGVKPGMKITPAEAEKLLDEDLAQFESDVDSLVKVPITSGQRGALVSFAFNTGSDIDDDEIAEGLGDSTLLKLLNMCDYEGAANQFPRWVKSNGVVLQGLVKRRAAERDLFLKSMLSKH